MRTLAALVFPGFQTLDFFGPIEMLGDPTYGIEIITVAKTSDPVPSRHGQILVALIPAALSSHIAASDKSNLHAGTS